MNPPPAPLTEEMSPITRERRKSIFDYVETRSRMLSIGDKYDLDAVPICLPVENLFENNVKWAAKVKSKHPEFFADSALQQKPDYLWIGCADSRVAANEIVGLIPGELFVHRNVANVVAHTDFNCLSVLQYSVEVLQVKHVIVCGHYGCGGVLATLVRARVGLVDNWLRHVDDVMQKHKKYLCTFADTVEKGKRLCELNTIEQAVNVCNTTVVRDAWLRGQAVAVHAFIYGMDDGLLRDLHFSARSEVEIEPKYEFAINNLPK